MKLHVGQTVIHPHHGPAVVGKVMTRTIRGEQVDYAELEVVSSKLSISLPVGKAEEIGIRDVAGLHELDRLAELGGHHVGDLRREVAHHDAELQHRYDAEHVARQHVDRGAHGHVRDDAVLDQVDRLVAGKGLGFFFLFFLVPGLMIWLFR